MFGIVKQSEGNIWVYSEPGRGTTFKVYLPVTEAAESVGPRPATSVALGGSETILLVEDEAALRDLIREVLETLGYTVLVASRGTEAFELARRHTGSIHLILTDVVMPGLGGRELAERISAARPGVKVLYMSGYTDHAIVRNGTLEQGVSFLQKPFAPDALARRVREVLDNPPQHG